MKDDPRDGIQSWSADGFWTSQGSPVLFVGATEAKFLRAETLFRDNKPNLAKGALKEAITSSMNKYQIDVTTDKNMAYMDSVNTTIDGLASDDFIKVLITEAYKHLFARTVLHNYFTEEQVIRNSPPPRGIKFQEDILMYRTKPATMLLMYQKPIFTNEYGGTKNKATVNT